MTWPMFWAQPSPPGPLVLEETTACVWVFWGRGWHHPQLWDRPSLLESLMTAWATYVSQWFQQVPPHATLWRLPGFYVLWWEPDPQILIRSLYHWLALHRGQVVRMEEQPRLSFRVGAAVGVVWRLTHDDGTFIDVWGPTVTTAQGLAERAGEGTVWIDRAYYDAVYTIMPGRSRPPVRVPGLREPVMVYQMEWGLPGRYLIEPPV